MGKDNIREGHWSQQDWTWINCPCTPIFNERGETWGLYQKYRNHKRNFCTNWRGYIFLYLGVSEAFPFIIDKSWILSRSNMSSLGSWRRSSAGCQTSRGGYRMITEMTLLTKAMCIEEYRGLKKARKALKTNHAARAKPWTAHQKFCERIQELHLTMVQMHRSWWRLCWALPLYSTVHLIKNEWIIPTFV